MVWLLALVGGFAHSADRPRDLTIQFQHVADGHPLVLNRLNWNRPDRHKVSVTRLDYLLSEIALKKPNGAWMKSRDWYAYISVEAERTRATLNAVPPGRYTAMRFRVGLDPKINQSDPARYPPRHPLNPQLNNLHWSWKDGYVFVAIEGHHRKHRQGSPGGYTFHLGNSENSVMVEIPTDLDSRVHSTAMLNMRYQRLLEGISLEHDGSSTHSRPGDRIAATMKRNLETNRVFTLARLSSDRYRELVLPSPTSVAASPFQLNISRRLPRPEFPTDNPLTRVGVELGARLFDDTRLSGNGTVSCKSCHDPDHGFTDEGFRFSSGIKGREGTRNSMPLFNLAWHREFFWDGRARSLREQVLQPIRNPKEMDAKLPDVIERLQRDASYPDLFRQAFGDSEVTAERLAKALEQFLLSLISQNSKFDLAARGEVELTEEEKRGLQLFVTEHDPKRNLRGADCFHCHGGNLFTNHRFFNTGLDLVSMDPGRMAVTGEESDRGKFKTPSLRNVTLTAPYMHDGRFKTLEEVVEHYNSGVQRSANLDPNLAKHPAAGLNLSAADKRALVAFLKTLTEQPIISQPTP